MNLKPVRKCEYYCFDIDQTRHIALLVLNDESNKKIITKQEKLIADYKRLVINSNATVEKQKVIIANKDHLIANNKISLDKKDDVSKLEIKRLKKIHRKNMKKMTLIVVAETILVVLVLIVK